MKRKDVNTEGRAESFMDIDRMVNEGLGGGRVSYDSNGLIEETVDITEEEPPDMAVSEQNHGG